jgi:hypothetical protein
VPGNGKTIWTSPERQFKIHKDEIDNKNKENDSPLVMFPSSKDPRMDPELINTISGVYPDAVTQSYIAFNSNIRRNVVESKKKQKPASQHIPSGNHKIDTQTLLH